MQITGVITAKNSVGAIPSTVFYVQDPQRSTGIRVAGATTCSQGEIVSVIGQIGTEAER